MPIKIEYSDINNSDLFIDAIYCSPRPPKGGYRDDVLHIMFPGTKNTGGFRISYRNDKSVAYVALHLASYEPSWPDSFDSETGVLTYFGDNRKGGRNVEETNIGGNKLLRVVFDLLAKGENSIKEIPPFFVFENTGECRDVKFLGLAVPGIVDSNEDEFFNTVWRSNKTERFPNYKARFTILDLGAENIKREWIDKLRLSKDCDDLAPEAWKKFKRHGLKGVNPLKAKPIFAYPNKKDQLPDDEEGTKILKAIYERYGKEDSTGFERFCKKIMTLMDPNYKDIELTRPWRDGGRDAIAKYVIKTPTKSLSVECAMEAKCYNPERQSGVGVKQTSRLISRIRNRQFGLLITTSYVDDQAYKEIIEDGHPILFCTGIDIVRILREKENITSKNIGKWLDENVE